MMVLRIVVIGCFLTAGACLCGAEETLTLLSNEAFSIPKKPPVPFLHDSHNEAAGIDTCETCHHVYEEGKIVADESSEGTPCADCHTAVHFGPGVTLMEAYHKQCKGCHLSAKQGPIVCGQCHSAKAYYSVQP